MDFKFEHLEVWKLALEYIDDVYRLTGALPKEEIHNLRNQWVRAATSVAPNIAEGSTGQSDPEQERFLGYAIRSLVECAACYRLAQRRGYLAEDLSSANLETQMESLIRKPQSFRRAVQGNAIIQGNGKAMVRRPSSMVE
jgi:four helix bundle protein